MRTAIWILTAVVAAAASDGNAGDSPTPDSLLAEYQKSAESLARVRIEWTTTDRFPAAPKELKQYDFTLLRDGSRWKVNEKLWSPAVSERRRAEANRRTQWLIGEEVVGAQQYYDGPELRPGRVLMTWWRKQSGAKFYLPRFRVFLPVFGYLWGDGGHPVWTVMREAGSLELLPKTEIVDGVETFVLRSEGKYGEHKVWLDPASGGLPRRIEVNKRPGNLLDDEQLGTVPAPPPGTLVKPRQPGAAPPRRECSFRVDKVHIDKKGSAFVITEFESTMSDVVVDGRKGEFKNAFKARLFDLDLTDLPPSAFQFDIEIPEGTIVFVVGPGDERIDDRYEWVDGKVRERVGK